MNPIPIKNCIIPNMICYLLAIEWNYYIRLGKYII